MKDMNQNIINQWDKEITSDTETVLGENNLELIETGFFREKKHIARVKDANGNFFILKTGKIDPLQVELLETAKTIESKLCFRVPSIIKKGEGWFLTKEIEGKLLNDYFDEKPEWCVEVSKKISDSYQWVIEELQKTQKLSNLLGDGQEWLFSRLSEWSRPIIDAGLIEKSEIEKIKRDFSEVIARKGENFFGFFHGNIIGDHIIVSGEDFYLIDLAVSLRVGRDYYDFLRALDFMFLKSTDEEKIFSLIPKWIEQYLPEADEDEVKLVFAFRNIGILGWDILHLDVEYTKGNISKKKELILKFIKREY